MKKKYPTTSGYYVYMHRTPEMDCSFGMSQQQPSKRWRPSAYKETSFKPYIDKFGWDNIEHVVLFDGLTKHQAEVLEDWFIKNAQRDGFCLNRNRSGGIKRDNKKEYQRECCHRYRQHSENKEKQRKYQREYSERPENKEKRREYDRKRYQTEKYKEYESKRRQTEERKEYQREYQREYRLKKKLNKNQ